MQWNTQEYILGNTKNFKLTENLACFDLDGTLIKTKSKKKFAVNKDDWEFYSNNVISTLNSLSKDKFCIIIITNQAGLTNDEKIDLWKKKVDDIVLKINLPIKLFASTSHNIYRKPLPTLMLQIYQSLKDSKLKLSNKSFYCGDACGRPGDHGDCDYKFALNSNLQFLTPNQLFENEEVIIPEIIYPAFNEIIRLSKSDEIEFEYDKGMIIMVGLPGSGKSTFVKNTLEPLGYVRINRDTSSSMAKCLRETKINLENGKSVVIDNINHDIKSREKYIKLAKQYNYNVKCIIIDVSLDTAMHNSMYRYYKDSSRYIPNIVYRVYKKNYVEPETKEAIIEILKIKPKYNITETNYIKLYMY